MMAIAQMQAIAADLADLSGRVGALEDAPSPTGDSIGTQTNFHFNSKGEIERIAEGSEGLPVFKDKFTTAASYENYVQALKGPAVATLTEPTATGLRFSQQLNPEHPLSEQIWLPIKAYRDAEGRGRCIDHIAVLKFTAANTNLTRRWGHLARFATATPANEIFQGWHTRVEGLGAFKEWSSLNTTAYSSIANGVQLQKIYGEAALAIKWPITLWLMVCCLAHEVQASIWTVDPLSASTQNRASKVSVSSLNQNTGQGAENIGVVAGTPSDVGIGIVGAEGDEINEYTVIPLTHR